MQSSSTEAVPILNEFSRCLSHFWWSKTSSSEIVVHKCMCCQKAMTSIRHDCEAQGIFLWQDKSYRSLVKRHDQIFDWLSDCNTIHSIWKFTCKALRLIENWDSNTQLFFSNLETCSQIPLFKWKAMLYIFSLFTGSCLADVSKCITLHAILSLHCGILPTSWL